MACREAEWDGEHLGEWIQFLDGAEAVVNLTGRSVNCRHTQENLREINESRVNSVGAVAAAIYHVTHPPRVWVQAGSLAFYGDTDDRWCDETTPPPAKAKRRKPASFGKMPLTTCWFPKRAACCCESESCWGAMAARCLCSAN